MDANVGEAGAQEYLCQKMSLIYGLLRRLFGNISPYKAAVIRLSSDISFTMNPLQAAEMARQSCDLEDKVSIQGFFCCCLLLLTLLLFASNSFML